LKHWPELEKAIDMLGTGDILVVAEWDRATRSMFDGIEIIKRVNDRGALIKVLAKPHLDLTTPLGRAFVAFLSAMAEDERQRILARCNAGRLVAIKDGVRFGRKPKLTDHQQAEALKRRAAGESCRAIAKTMAVHHGTIVSRLGVGRLRSLIGRLEEPDWGLARVLRLARPASDRSPVVRPPWSLAASALQRLCLSGRPLPCSCPGIAGYATTFACPFSP
jgi:Resolvase, N terminal domain